MPPGSPYVSVIIPAFNQAQYLALAINSALTQTSCDREIIVVDDGSTDDTPAVARQFGTAIQYVRQGNLGLAGARNTGIRHARGAFIALLDSDDEWHPGFLQEILSLASETPGATVYFSGATCVDADGNQLPQSIAVGPIDSDAMYQTMLRANPLVPSAILMRREAIIAAGGFDQSFRQLEDWHLWLRLLRAGHVFAGSPKELVRYRIHGNSLSTRRDEMRRTALEMAASLFGPDDEMLHTWTENKRRCYGGVYRYNAISAATFSKDWRECARYLTRALQVDPTLAGDLGLYYELALGAQPMGYRGTAFGLDLDENVLQVENLLATVFRAPAAPELEEIRQATYSTANYALALVAYNVARFALSNRLLAGVLSAQPASWRDRRLTMLLLKSLVRRLGFYQPPHGHVIASKA